MLRNFLTGLVLWLAAGTALAAVTTPPSVETFFSFDKISDVQISPDGKYLALAVPDAKTGETRKGLVIVTAEGDHKVTASFRFVGYQIVDQFWWTLNDRILASTATQDTGFFEAPVRDGSLYAINADGTKQMQIMPREIDGDIIYFNGPFYMHGDDPRHVLVYGATRGLNSSYNQIAQIYTLDTYSEGGTNNTSEGGFHKVDEGGSHKVLISPLQNGGFISDQEANIRFATGEDLKSGARELLYRAEPSSHDWQDLSALLPGDDPADPENGPVDMTPDDKGLYWFARTPTSTLGFYTLDLATHNLKELYSDPDVDVDRLVWSFDWMRPWKVIAVETMPGLPQVHIIEPDDPKAQDLASLYQAFDGQHVTITSNTRDGHLMVVRVSSDRNPGQYYLFNDKTGQASFLFASKPEIDSTQMASMRPVTFQARDGVTVHAYLTLPVGSSAKDLPLIVNPHGGPHGIRDMWGWDPEVQYFASHGYAVLQVNYRGSGGYGMKFQDLGYGHWATTMQDDLADAVQWAVKQGTVDPNRVCIYGASYGGYAAMENAERYPNLYRCVAGYVGLYDLKTMSDSDYTHYAAGRNYNGTVVGRNDAQLAADSPVNGAGKINAPVFIIYGGQDKRVVPANAEEMMTALDKAGKKYQKLYEPLEQHGFYKPEHRYEVYTQLLAFFDANIGPDAPKH